MSQSDASAEAGSGPIAVARTVADLRSAVAEARLGGRTIGLVPTMGALHAGHGALVAAARRATGYVIATIFVNPTQFGPAEDLAQYPRTWDADLALMAQAAAFAREVRSPSLSFLSSVQGDTASSETGRSS